MGSKKKPGIPAADYFMSQHFGVAAIVDSINKIRIKDKLVWTGNVLVNSVISIAQRNLFGGPKKEGGVGGRVHVLLGGEDQLLSDELAARLERTPATAPGFRGITSLFFTGGGTESAAGFYWGSNSGYLPVVDVEVTRAPDAWYPEKAMVPRLEAPVERLSNYVYVAVACATAGVDASDTGMWWLDRNWTANPNWSRDFGDSAQFSGLHSYVQSVVADPPIDSQHPFLSTSVSGIADGITPYNLYMLAIEVDMSGGTPGSPTWRDGRAEALYRFLTYSGELIATIRLWYDPVLYKCRASWSSSDGVTFELEDPATSYPQFSFNLRIELTADGIVARRGIWSDTKMPPGSILFGNPLPLLACQALEISQCQVSFAVSDSTEFVDAPDFPLSGTYATLRAWGPKEFEVAPDANPAHVIYDCLTNSTWGLGLPTTMIDHPSFVRAADTLYAEGFGISLTWTSQTTIEAFVNDVLSHIDGTYGVDQDTGKIYLTLVRGDYTTEELLLLDEDNSSVTRFQRKAFGETSNEVVVTWTNPENEKEQTVAVHDTGNFAVQGAIVSHSANFYGIRYVELAMRTAMREMAKVSNPVAMFEIEADRRASRVKSGGVVRLTATEYGIDDLPVRVITVNYGRPGSFKVQISAIEDVFSRSTGSYVDTPGTEHRPTPNYPQPIANSLATAVPYYMAAVQFGDATAQAIPEEVGYGLLLGSTAGVSGFEATVLEPQLNALGQEVFTEAGSIPLAGHGRLNSDLIAEPLSTGVLLTGLQGDMVPLEGRFLWIGDDPLTAEIGLIESLAAGAFNIRRGQLDTTPKAWVTGTNLWIIDPEVDLVDETDRGTGQLLRYKLLTNSSSAQLDPGMAPEITGTLVPRYHLPYRPANVLLNGLAWPEFGTAPLTVTFARRNRFLENPVALRWTDGDVVPEIGQTTSVALYRVDTNALLTETTGIAGTSVVLDSTYSGIVRLTVKSVRAGLDSYQSFSHVFEMVIPRSTESGEDRVTEDGQLRILEA